MIPNYSTPNTELKILNKPGVCFDPYNYDNIVTFTMGAHREDVLMSVMTQHVISRKNPFVYMSLRTILMIYSNILLQTNRVTGSFTQAD